MNSTNVLDLFKEITRIPRESGHEAPITAWLQQFAAARGLECRTDDTGNVVIVKPASPGKENVPAIALQSHQDMVCEKLAGFDFDFAKDPIPYEKAIVEINKKAPAWRSWRATFLPARSNVSSPSRKRPAWTALRRCSPVSSRRKP